MFYFDGGLFKIKIRKRQKKNVVGKVDQGVENATRTEIEGRVGEEKTIR